MTATSATEGSSQSVAIESATTHWWQWLIAKLFSGLGVGMLQATLPVYIVEHSPTQLRGFFINAYTLYAAGKLSGVGINSAAGSSSVRSSHLWRCAR